MLWTFMVLEGFKKRLSCRQPYIRELQRYIGPISSAMENRVLFRRRSLQRRQNYSIISGSYAVLLFLSVIVSVYAIGAPLGEVSMGRPAQKLGLRAFPPGLFRSSQVKQ
jgi:hypothetical protein